MIGPLIALRPLSRLNLIEALSPWLSLLGPLPFRPGLIVPGLLVGYLVGVIGCLAWLGLGWWASRHLAWRAQTAPGTVLDVYRGLAYPRRWDRPSLRVSPLVTRPILIGFIRPTIVLPAPLAEGATETELKLALRHELAHAAHFDPVFSLIGGLAFAFLFFFPPIWWARRQLRLDQEFLADHRVANGPRRSPVQYVTSLVALAHARAPGPEGAAAPSQGPIATAGSTLIDRVRMLLQCPFRIEPSPPWWWRLVVGPGLVVGLLGASSLTIDGFHRVPRERSRPDLTVPFVMGALTLPPATGQDAHAGFELPPRLPGAFTLRLEVFSTRAEAERIEVAGYQVRPVDDGPFTDAPTWHALRIARTAGVEIVELDGKVVPHQRAAGAAAERLRVRTRLGRPLELRNLVLTPDRKPPS